MKFLKWFGALFIVYAIGDIGKMFLTHSMSAIDKNMNNVVAEISPKLPMNNDIGLTVTRVTYNSPTMRQYFSIPRGVDPERDYKHQLVDAACSDKTLWMFKKGFRVENIFQPESTPSSTTLDLGVSDTTIVIDEKQCEHRGETYITAAQVVSTKRNTSTGFAPQAAAPVYESPAVVAAPPADTAAAAPADTAAAAY